MCQPNICPSLLPSQPPPQKSTFCHVLLFHLEDAAVAVIKASARKRLRFFRLFKPSLHSINHHSPKDLPLCGLFNYS